VKEDTSSSQSGLHFGHYIAGTDCDYISQFHALRVSLSLKKGIALERWLKGLSVMLEKMFGVRLVSTLRAILLMEADFNTMNKEVYGVWMLDNARRYKLIPEEIFSEQNRTADDGGLAKTLFYDIACQTRTPAAIASVDASNCYDRCDNIHPWISTTGDLAFSHQQEFTVLNSQKGFQRSLPEISLFSLSSLFCQ